MNTEQELKTSEEWQKIHWATKVLDPDGWDRTNFQHSWHEEKITETEYWKRASYSTVSFYA